MKTLRVGVLAALAAGGLACRDLSLPSPEGSADGGVALVGGTELTLLAPDLAAVQPQVTTVRVRLSDVNGLRAATLACGDVVLASWLAGGETERELERRVDLGPCRPEGLEAGGVAEVQLGVQSVDATGVQQVHGPFRLQALFSARGSEDAPAELSVEVPERVAPLTPLTLRVRASTPLTALPAVSIDGRAAAVRAEAADGGLADAWVAELPGGLPLAVPTSDAPPDLSVSERVALVQVTAHSPGGGTTQVSVPLTVSRVLWERYLPAALYVDTDGVLPDRWATRPVPTPEGLVLALQRTGDSSTWLPVLVEARTGAVQRLPAEVAERGWVARGLTAGGRVLLQDLKAGLAELRGVTTPADGGVAVPVVDQGFDRPLPLGDRLCMPQARATGTPDGGFCATPSELTLDCLEADGRTTRVTAPGPVGAEGRSGYQWASGDALLTLPLVDGTGCCTDCPTSAVLGTPGGLTHVAGFRGGQLTEDFERILPDGAGGFAVVLDWAGQVAAASAGESVTAARAPLPASNPIVRAYVLHGDGTVSADVTGVAGRDTQHLVGLVPGDVLVSVVGGTQTTWVEGWKPQALEPTWAQELPGSLLPFYSWNPDLDERNRSLFFADGSGVALLRRDGSFDDAVVVGFGPGLKPTWVYYVPGPSRDVRLFLAPDGRQVYLVSVDGAAVTALAR